MTKIVTFPKEPPFLGLTKIWRKDRFYKFWCNCERLKFTMWKFSIRYPLQKIISVRSSFTTKYDDQIRVWCQKYAWFSWHWPWLVLYTFAFTFKKLAIMAICPIITKKYTERRQQELSLELRRIKPDSYIYSIFSSYEPNKQKLSKTVTGLFGISSV